MEDGMTTADLVRLIGLMGVGVGIAWAVQIVGFPVAPPTAPASLWSGARTGAVPRHLLFRIARSVDSSDRADLI